MLADVLARYHRLKGDEVFFLTGVDQHGQKVQQSAATQGVPPQEFVDGITSRFLSLWEKLGLSHDGWAATTADRHKKCVQAILQRLWDDKGADGQSKWLYKKTKADWYSVRQEQFLTDKERGPDGEFGPEWGVVEYREEENYYFRITDHREWLLDLIETRSAAGHSLVYPEFRSVELRHAVEKTADDLCITRPKSRLTWGIEVPFDPEFVTFVWFDALVNYISFAPGYDPTPGADLTEFHRWWPALHIIGKDILAPSHGIYWPIMLKALGFSDAQIPTLLVHGWWNRPGGEKLSKSLGNAADPSSLADEFGAEALRYYLVKDISTGKDSEFSLSRLVLVYNADLANNLGNLLNRSLNMLQKYREGVLRKVETEADQARVIREAAASTLASYAAHFEAEGRFQVHQALEELNALVITCNAAIEISAPWKLAKQPEAQDQLSSVLYALHESIRIVAILISPVLPQASRAIFDQLDPHGTLERDFRLTQAAWGVLPDGHLIGSPTPVFPRKEPIVEEASAV